MNLLNEINKKFQELQSKDLLRERVFSGIKVKYNYSSNDYLSLSKSFRAKFWLLWGVLFYGKAKCSSKYLNGYSKNHQKLERIVAHSYGADDTVIFSSGYLASIGVLQGLCNSKTIIIADRHIHASWIDATFAVKASIARFQHNNLAHLKQLLQKYNNRSIIILIESVFSMQGTVVDLFQYEKLAKKFGAILISDNAHSLGVLPCYKPSYSLHLQVGTFSKACAGFGGYVCGNKVLIKAITNFGRTQIYSTVLPEYILFFNRHAFQFVQKKSGKVLLATQKLAIRYNFKFHGSGILTKEFESIAEARAFQEDLIKTRIYAPVIRPPTVPKPIIRISVHL